MKAQNLFRTLFWLLLGIIFAISLLPAEEAPAGFANDKLNHFLAFLSLSLIARILYSRIHIAILFAMLALFGGAIELLQLAMALGRQADWLDFATDIAAIVLGLLAGNLLNSMTGQAPLRRKFRK